MIESSRERIARLAIHVGVALAAAYVSLRHVYEWSMQNASVGADWTLGATNALVSELVPVYCLLWIRQRRRLNRSTLPGWVVLVATAAFSITAQVAVATPTLSGWVVSAAGTLGFWILTKMGLSLASAPTTAAPEPLSARVPEPAAASTAADPEAAAERTQPAMSARANPQRQVRTKQVRPRSLTSADKVMKALDALPDRPTVEQVAAKASVGVSTVRRHAPAHRLAPTARRRVANLTPENESPSHASADTALAPA